MKSDQKAKLGIVIAIVGVGGALVYWLNRPSMKVESVGAAPPMMAPSKSATDEKAEPTPTPTPVSDAKGAERSRGGGGIKNPDAKK